MYRKRPSPTRWLIPAVLILCVLAALLAYQYPPVRRLVTWRIEVLTTYLRGIVYPAGPMPTPLASPTPTSPEETPPPPSATPSATASPTAPAPSATPPGPTATPIPSPTPLPAAISLPAPAWEKQDINNCGPAALAMYLRYYGWEGDQFNISTLIKPIPEDRNVNPEELLFFVRTRAGWLNAEYRVNGTMPLLKQLLAAEIPVIIEESFYFDDPFWPNDDLWAAHYLLLTGYDDAAQVFTGQDSFHGADQKVSYQQLDDYWRIFNRVYFLVYLPTQEEQVKTILGEDWDVQTNRQRALDTAQSETQKNADDAFAWFNLGSNLVYFEKYSEAANAYDKARLLKLPQRMLRYQFGPFFAYFHAHRYDDLLALAEYALERTPNSEEALLWRGWARYRKGSTAGAIEDWRAALKARPGFEDAHYALDFVGAAP